MQQTVKTYRSDDWVLRLHALTITANTGSCNSTAEAAKHACVAKSCGKANLLVGLGELTHVPGERVRWKNERTDASFEKSPSLGCEQPSETPKSCGRGHRGKFDMVFGISIRTTDSEE
jgi:hypothetical protein